MSHIQVASKYTCSLLAVFCGRNAENEQIKNVLDETSRYPFPDLVSSGRLEVKLYPRLLSYLGSFHL